MTVYVIRNGKVVVKPDALAPMPRPHFPSPMISRFTPMESPVTGRVITSWRDRDRDMQAVNAFDGRDLPKDFVFSRGRDVQEKEARDAARGPQPDIWRDAD